MIVTLLLIGLAVQLAILWRLVVLQQQVDAIRGSVSVALQDRLDAMALVRERIAQRVVEWKAGGGRDKLRARLRERDGVQ